ncbi:hypothetical protein B0H10DRAFT_1840949 [Mycena sp. CBHHK59/15]|nr:hypothetical protein B0H10DRAFT_1840949 [Mycena sp. CBHHK59/15]
MHTYARTVVDALQSQSVALLDTYGVPAYIADERIAYTDAPLRYLSTGAPSPALTQKAGAQPFAPPNLVQSTSAAFVALQTQRGAPATLVLLPAPHIAPAAPRTLERSNFAHWDEDAVHWAPATVRAAQALAFGALGEPGRDAWTAPTREEKPSAAQERKKPVEFGMYI